MPENRPFPTSTGTIADGILAAIRPMPTHLAYRLERAERALRRARRDLKRNRGGALFEENVAMFERQLARVRRSVDSELEGRNGLGCRPP
jgi:hypothetical protein